MSGRHLRVAPLVESAPAFSPRAVAYFADRAIDAGVVVRVGVTECADGIVFPTFDFDGGSAPRIRMLREGGPKVKGPAGASPAPWWPLGGPCGGGEVLVCEGESDALAAVSAVLGDAAPEVGELLADELSGVVAIPGASYPAERLVASLREHKVAEVMLALDGDKAGRSATPRLARALREAGMDVRVLVLPDGRDLADCLAQRHGRDRAAWLANAMLDAQAVADEPPEPDHDSYRWRTFNLRRLVDEADEEVPWRCVGIAADGYLTLLPAHGGVGKTWLALALAGGVMAGAAVAGIECRPGRVVLFDAENGGKLLGRRLKTAGLPLDDQRLAIHDAAGLDLTKADDLAWMAREMEGAALVVCDSLRSLAPGTDENDSGEMAAVLTGLRRLARDTGAAVVVLDHTGHNGLPRGSTAKRDQVDLLITMGAEEADPDRQTRRVLRCDPARGGKCRIDEAPAERWIELRGWHGTMTFSEAEPFDPGARGGGDKASPAVGQMLDRVVAHMRAAGGPVSQASVATVLTGQKSNGTVRRALQLGQDRGCLRKREDGLWEAAEGVAKADLATLGNPGKPSMASGLPAPPPLPKEGGGYGHPDAPGRSRLGNHWRRCPLRLNRWSRSAKRCDLTSQLISVRAVAALLERHVRDEGSVTLRAAVHWLRECGVPDDRLRTGVALALGYGRIEVARGDGPTLVPAASEAEAR